MTSVLCPACNAESEPGRKFCGECGSALARACPSCGAANAPTMKFCGECGSPLGTGASDTPVPNATASDSTAERRLVSVLFADLVGFTTLSETRDAEQVRDLLSRYFETCRRLTAERVYEGLGTPFFLAVTQLEHAGWLTARGEAGDAAALLAAAREVFDGLGAVPWLERADRLLVGAEAETLEAAPRA